MATESEESSDGKLWDSPLRCDRCGLWSTNLPNPADLASPGVGGIITALGRGPKYVDLQIAHMSFHLFVLCKRFERVRTKTSLCCRGASQPSSALGPLTMCSDARLRAEAPIEFTRPGIVVIGRIPNVSALPLKYTRCTQGGECLGVCRKGNDWPED